MNTCKHTIQGIACWVALMTASHSAQASQSVQQRAQYVLQCPHQTEMHFPEGDPRREAFAQFTTCSLPLIIRPTEHPNIVEIESPSSLHRFDYVLYSAENANSFEYLGQSFLEAWNTLMRQYPQYITAPSGDAYQCEIPRMSSQK